MTDKLTRQIGANLRSMRRAQKLTQAELATKADNMDSNYYAKIERGDIKPAVAKYQIIAKALGVDLSDVLKV